MNHPWTLVMLLNAALLAWPAGARAQLAELKDPAAALKTDLQRLKADGEALRTAVDVAYPQLAVDREALRISLDLMKNSCSVPGAYCDAVKAQARNYSEAVRKDLLAAKDACAADEACAAAGERLREDKEKLRAHRDEFLAAAGPAFDELKAKAARLKADIEAKITAAEAACIAAEPACLAAVARIEQERARINERLARAQQRASEILARKK